MNTTLTAWVLTGTFALATVALAVALTLVIRRKDVWYLKWVTECNAHVETAVERDQLRTRFANWLPSEKDADEAFAEAERMAMHRRRIQSGRASVPRSDAGAPARISRPNTRRSAPGA